MEGESTKHTVHRNFLPLSLDVITFMTMLVITLDSIISLERQLELKKVLNITLKKIKCYHINGQNKDYST